MSRPRLKPHIHVRRAEPGDDGGTAAPGVAAGTVVEPATARDGS